MHPAARATPREEAREGFKYYTYTYICSLYVHMPLSFFPVYRIVSIEIEIGNPDFGIENKVS